MVEMSQRIGETLEVVRSVGRHRAENNAERREWEEEYGE